jgi:hypothetical protein
MKACKANKVTQCSADKLQGQSKSSDDIGHAVICAKGRNGEKKFVYFNAPGNHDRICPFDWSITGR